MESEEEEKDFLTTKAASMKIESIKLQFSGSNAAILVVKSGRALLKDCELQGSYHTGIVVKEGAHLTMEKCKIDHATVGSCSNGKYEFTFSKR